MHSISQPIKSLYNHLKVFVSEYVDRLCIAIETQGNQGFFKLNIVEVLTKLFVSFMTFFATLYELVSYIGRYHFSLVKL